MFAGHDIMPAFVAGPLGFVSREFLRRHGDEIAAVAFRKMELDNLATQKVIKKTSTGYVKNFLKTAKTGVNGAYIASKMAEGTVDQYKEDIKEIEYFQSNQEKFQEAFIDRNQAIVNFMPDVSTMLYQKSSDAIMFLESKLPRQRHSDFADTDWTPSDIALRKYHRYRNAVINPASIFEMAKEGYIPTEAIETMKEVYPSIYESFVESVNITMGKEKIPHNVKRQISANLSGNKPVTRSALSIQLMRQIRGQETAEDQAQAQQQRPSKPLNSRGSERMTKAQRTTNY